LTALLLKHYKILANNKTNDVRIETLMALRSVPMNNDKDKNDDGHEGLFRIKNK
jgi:hypothetical protein